MSFNKRILSAGAAPFVNSKNFKAITYAGNGGTQAITGLGFQPDFVWIKNRTSNGQSPLIQDSTRGTGSTKVLFSSETSLEGTYGQYGHVSAFGTDGFTVVDGDGEHTNSSNKNYVAWCWKAGGGTTSSNTDGTNIDSTVQVNADAGFSIVQFTTPGTFSGSNTVGHGLGVTPNLIIMKSTSTAGENWMVHHTDLGNGGYIRLNTTGASGTSGNLFTGTSSTVFNPADTSAPNISYISYCFANVDGFSKFGSYTGNGSANGPIVETGFEPAFLMIKRTDTADSWVIHDNKRDLVNPRKKYLLANATNAEAADLDGIDFLSNGFQLKDDYAYYNASGGTYIYMAFAADPDTEAPTLADSFDVQTYNMTGGSDYDLSFAFKPQFVITKTRDEDERWSWGDIIRGNNSNLSSNDTNAVSTTNQWRVKDWYAGATSVTIAQHASTNTSNVSYAWKADDNEPTIFGGPAKAVYKFEDNANDVTGTYNGTANSITYATGNFNKAAVFNGSSGDIDLPADIESSTMAVSLWAYLDDNAPTNQIIIEFDNGYGLNFPSFASGKLAAQWANSNANHTLSNVALSNGQWYHIAANFRSGATDLYINGVKQTTGGTADDYLTADQNTIGSRRSGEFFDGMIDQVRIYNGNFQQLHVDELYAETASDNDDLELGGPPETIVSANANAGFSIVKYDGQTTALKIPHGLSAAPNMIIAKNISSSGKSWTVFHSSLGAGKILRLESAGAEITNDVFWGGTSNAPNATTFSVGVNNDTNAENGSAYQIIAYCFHSVSGYSKFGSYTGGGSTNPTITVGFTPDWVMVKKATGTMTGSSGWTIVDSARHPGTPSYDNGNVLYANGSLVEQDDDNQRGFIITSTGFSPNGNYLPTNNSGDTYIYAAFKIN